ncbi:response regulator [Pseudomonas sp. H11T01]|uniref:response regulator n=1 Tax=Pseudomonas sp. H11T01 TaxID=3402749 RepID=UPI003AD5B29A
MLNKTLRILIADEQYFHRMKIERMLNQLGYFRIAPAQCVEELLTLVEYGSEPFDLVMISASLTAGVDLDLLAFCGGNQQIHHGFIYDGQHVQLTASKVRQPQRVQVIQARMPDLEMVRRLMDMVDPQTNGAQAPMLPWLRTACQSHMG